MRALTITVVVYRCCRGRVHWKKWTCILQTVVGSVKTIWACRWRCPWRCRCLPGINDDIRTALLACGSLDVGQQRVSDIVSWTKVWHAYKNKASFLSKIIEIIYFFFLLSSFNTIITPRLKLAKKWQKVRACTHHHLDRSRPPMFVWGFDRQR